MNLSEITDLDELRDICTSTDKYLESRANLVKHKEVEIFKKALKLMELKSRALSKLASKQKSVEAMKPDTDQTFANRETQQLLVEVGLPVPAPEQYLDRVLHYYLENAKSA